MNELRGLWRGKRIDNGEWVKGFLSKSRNIEEKPALLKPCIDFEDKGVMVSCIVDPDTLGECTGLRDIKGTLIFEGDWIRDLKTGKKGLVSWSDTGAGFVCRYGSDIYDTNGLIKVRTKRAVVVGNIHDNPELHKRATGEDNGNVAQDALTSAD